MALPRNVQHLGKVNSIDTRTRSLALPYTEVSSIKGFGKMRCGLTHTAAGIYYLWLCHIYEFFMRMLPQC